ncbi:hypothetical protein TWF481_010454 [Arthrobotrys musiformis]|uniref:Uncharacterized protein n=1 Tax=Arthrobotrys musiformis TaxID=47236 RepID=A0AAV9W6S5_9PEZI
MHLIVLLGGLLPLALIAAEPFSRSFLVPVTAPIMPAFRPNPKLSTYINGKYTLDDPSIYRIKIDIRLPARLSPNVDIATGIAAILRDNVPEVLRQFNYTPAEMSPVVDKLATGLPDVLLSALAPNHPVQKRDLVVRNGFLDFLAGLGCPLERSLQAYLGVAAYFEDNNSNPKRTTSDLDYFLTVLHGSISKDAPVNVYYNANFPGGFQNADGTTIGKNVYLRLSGTGDAAVDPNFVYIARLLQHELQHSEQYRAQNWDLGAFGIRYLYNFCMAGFSYEDNQMEVDAFAAESAGAAMRDPVGLRFFRVWRHPDFSLAKTLSQPVERQYRPAPGVPGASEMLFVNGVLQTLPFAPAGDTTDRGVCFRTFTRDEILTRGFDNCTPRPQTSPPAPSAFRD